ncbi:hypothetical protein BIW11_03822 [Tropilaelaps mercedesae]|uniref:Uncharacterized protein n=1 Tax=Tropilaelaps mercedesae TaxID=418985 RepID=A0A1V9XFR9_9ACAR|nr:hypothetical protein BIW11_03822 [Tropilaelaps mercedesae]
MAADIETLRLYPTVNRRFIVATFISTWFYYLPIYYYPISHKHLVESAYKAGLALAAAWFPSSLREPMADSFRHSPPIDAIARFDPLGAYRERVNNKGTMPRGEERSVTRQQRWQEEDESSGHSRLCRAYFGDRHIHNYRDSP